MCVSYTLDGKEIDYVPADIDDFMRCTPNYMTLKGWHEDITQVKSFDELPEHAKVYLKTLSDLVKVDISIFSVGPDRNQTILVNDVF